ncbi:hypothetical protein MPDQ_003706 [Monascus purpureus]|uniref:Uncharacterized protein n=1 Tax=Monascus purpureus TaxID=5098 RepID=A0A507QMF9_MONPU|nr:hypothetical protein MPDQ_003706 [Monascus purpureus]
MPFLDDFIASRICLPLQLNLSISYGLLVAWWVVEPSHGHDQNATLGILQFYLYALRMPQAKMAAALSSTSADDAVALNFIMLDRDRDIIAGGSARVKVLRGWLQGRIV